MKLSEYLRIYRKTRHKFAWESGIPLTTVYRLLRGESIPSGKTLSRIHLATRGKVRVEDFVR